MQNAGYLNKKWLNTALAYLFVVALLGLLLRFSAVETIAGINFKYIVHAHSHTALLGWVYAALFVALLQNFLPAEVASGKNYVRLFWLTQLAVLGMLFSFPFQGYAAVSITFSTLHILLSYIFVYRFNKHLIQTELYRSGAVSVKFIRAALLFLLLSTIGPFSLGPLMTQGFSGSNLYYLAVYYYLHFQYNGWFTFAVFGLIFRWWERSGIQFSNAKGKLFFRLMFWACFPAYALSALWTQPSVWVYLVAGAAAAVQVAALIHFAISFSHIWHSEKMLLKRWTRFLLMLAFFAFAVKLALQLASALPQMADLAYKVREFVIGYLHLVLIGFVSVFLFAYFINEGAWQVKTVMAKTGLAMFISAFILSELLIFLQGILYWQYSLPIPFYTTILFIVSIFLPLGVGLFLVSQRVKNYI